ncbi:MAG: FAD-binding oxidoreductase [Nanoarchaeota archaeon]|nr:FAD-binding oxidoreductase [Nanoarchaeota archaeon]
MDLHEKKIARISEFLKNRVSNKKLTLKKKSVSHQVPKSKSYKSDSDTLDISDLNNIITIDKAKKTCTAEPGATFSDLVKSTIKHNLVPIVVPELKNITIGGAVSGCSVESTSYRYSGFHDTCLEYEIICTDGRVLKCTPENQNRLIFEMVHGAFGTLGIITKLRFRLMDAKTFVHLKYITCRNLKEYKELIWQHYHKKDIDFMDGIIHSKDQLVLCLGNFIDKVPYISRYGINGPYYKSTKNKKEDYLRTYDYFFRYDSDCHWIARKYGLENPLVRSLFGKHILGSENMLKTAKRLSSLQKLQRPDVVVDVMIPFSKLDEFYRFYVKEFDFFPLWIVPYRFRNYPWINREFLKSNRDKLFIDCAVYGMKQKKNKNYFKLLEDKLIQLGGIKTLISYNYYDKETFWKIFDKENYYHVKNMTDPNAQFLDIYTKTHIK